MQPSKPNRNQLRDAWRIAGAYWRSEEKWSGWGLLVAIVLLSLANVYVSVRINEWNKSFYNALQAFDRGEVVRQLGVFCCLALIAATISVNALYLNQMLQIRWRRWLTRRYVSDWLADRNYYRFWFTNTTDNPDQRIAEDIQQFVAYVMNLSVGLLSSSVLLVSFIFILWGLSGPLEIPLGKWGLLSIPAFLVWTALLYAWLATWLAM
jgi:vitamin B12/bleomycin/antimicrobial peptide transport system ATP-binding/permease protein